MILPGKYVTIHALDMFDNLAVILLNFRFHFPSNDFTPARLIPESRKCYILIDRAPINTQATTNFYFLLYTVVYTMVLVLWYKPSIKIMSIILLMKH